MKKDIKELPIYLRIYQIYNEFVERDILEMNTGGTVAVTISDAKKRGLNKKDYEVKQVWKNEEGIREMIDKGFFKDREVLIVMFERKELGVK